MSETTKFVITRSKWLRGGTPDSYLVRGDSGKMCCLGMVLEQCGIAADLMTYICTPAGLLEVHPDLQDKYPEALQPRKYSHSKNLLLNPTFVITAMNINDGRGLPDEERERRLKEHFQKEGLQLEFVD